MIDGRGASWGAQAGSASRASGGGCSRSGRWSVQDVVEPEARRIRVPVGRDEAAQDARRPVSRARLRRMVPEVFLIEAALAA